MVAWYNNDPVNAVCQSHALCHHFPHWAYVCGWLGEAETSAKVTPAEAWLALVHKDPPRILSPLHGKPGPASWGWKMGWWGQPSADLLCEWAQANTESQERINRGCSRNIKFWGGRSWVTTQRYYFCSESWGLPSSSQVRVTFKGVMSEHRGTRIYASRRLHVSGETHPCLRNTALKYAKHLARRAKWGAHKS